MSNFRRSLRIQSIINSAAPCPQRIDTSHMFPTAFDELCSWIMELLYSGWIVSLMNVSTEYKIISERRKENQKPNMFRTASIQTRLKTKYGDLLRFEKNSGNEVRISYITFLFTLNADLEEETQYLTLLYGFSIRSREFLLDCQTLLFIYVTLYRSRSFGRASTIM